MTYGITNAGGGKSADLGTKTITANDTYLASDDGLDGYSEVTVNVPAPAPNLQPKIARHNGTVTADSGYDGLSSVDVGVGQIGTSYSCANKSGGSYATNDKVWLNYKQTTPQRTDNLVSGTTSTQGFRGLYMSFDGSTVGVNGYASNNVSKYTITSGSAPVSATGFSWSYQAGEDYFIENTTTYVSSLSGSTTLSFSNEAVNTLNYKYLGGGLYVDGSNVKELSSGTTVYALPQNYTARLAKKLADNKYAIIIFNPNDLSVYYRCLVDNGVATLSSGLNVYSLSGNYYKFNGFTSDGKYLITGTIAVIIDIENWALATFSATFQAQSSGTLAYYNNIGDLLTYKGTDGYLHTYKYDTVSKDWTEVTELKVQTSGSCGIASYDGSILLYTTNMSSPNGNAVMQVAQNEGWVATTYGNINSDSLTGYAAEPISAGATGNVIVGTKVDGSSVTATNQTGSAIADGDRVYIISNNNLTLVPQNNFNPLISWTGVAAGSIANGSSGLVKTAMTEPTGSLNLYDRVGGIATVFMIYTDSLGTKYAVCLLDAQYRTGPLAFGSNGFDVTVMTTFGTTDQAVSNSRSSLVSASSQMGAVVNAGTLANSPAMNYCYGLTTSVGGITYRGLVPTVKELDAIYADRLALDTLDPTVADYPSKSLSTWNLGNDSNRTNGIYSCCPTSSGSYSVMITGSGSGYCSTDAYMTVKHGVMPVFEIPIA